MISQNDTAWRLTLAAVPTAHGASHSRLPCGSLLAFISGEFDVDREQELAVIRRAYAKQILAWATPSDPRLEAAFAAVPRERFLDPGPWPIMRYGGYVPTPDADPVYLYDDVLIGIAPERGLNNGAPSYHAPVLASAQIKEGEHVVHVGAAIRLAQRGA